jgi:cell division septal protein FtsQ
MAGILQKKLRRREEMKQASTIGLRGEMDFFRRNNNRHISRQKKIKTIKIKGLHLLLICILLVLIGISIYMSARFLLSWEELNVKTVRLVNSPRHGKAKVQKLLTYFQGNILGLSLDHLKKELTGIDEVKDVSISRILPTTVEIRFILREPVFQVLLNRRYHVIDVEGVSLYSLSGPRADLMIIRGIKKRELESIIPYLGELNKIRDSLEYIGYQQPYGVMIKLKGMKEEFYPGEQDYAEKITYFLKVKKLLALSQHQIKRVDLRFANRFYLEFDKEVVN